MKKLIIIAATVCWPVSAISQDCENIIGLSKLSRTVVQDNQAVEQHASNFCKEYAKSSGGSRSSSFGASYKFLAASYGSSRASMEEVASKYCSSTNIYSASKDAYKQYIESIAPGAYGAYEQCIRMSEQNIRFNVDPGSILPTEFTVSASFVSDARGDNKATLKYSSTEDVQCEWDDTSDTTKVLVSGSSGLLKCKRKNQNRASYVTIVNTASGDLPLTLPWQAYDDNGIPVNALESMITEISELRGKVVQLEKQLASTGKNESKVVKKTEFWNNTTTNTVGHTCERGSFLTGAYFDMTSENGVRTPTRLQFLCASKNP